MTARAALGVLNKNVLIHISVAYMHSGTYIGIVPQAIHVGMQYTCSENWHTNTGVPRSGMSKSIATLAQGERHVCLGLQPSAPLALSLS